MAPPIMRFGVKAYGDVLPADPIQDGLRNWWSQYFAWFNWQQNRSCGSLLPVGRFFLYRATTRTGRKFAAIVAFSSALRTEPRLVALLASE